MIETIEVTKRETLGSRAMIKNAAFGYRQQADQARHEIGELDRCGYRLGSFESCAVEQLG